MMSRTSFSFLLALLPVTSSKGFLGNDPALKAAQIQQELNGVLAEMLGHGHGVDDAHLRRIQEYLKPVFRALPKNMQGHLSAPVMRYAVQRYFTQRHGWVVKGFEAHARAANVSDDHILQSKLPDYIRTALEERFQNKGFALEDTAVMVASVERLTFDEVIRGVERAFQINSLPVTAEMSREQFFEVVDSYLITEMLEGADDREQHILDKEDIEKLYPHWQVTKSFVQDLADNEMYAGMHRHNPFLKKGTFHFEDVTRIGQQISEQFGAWSNHECTVIKDSLAEMDPHNTGRVKLSDFYSKSQNGGWQFRESSAYLRTLGALDESSTLLGPQVIIANYVSGMSNCITSAPYYAICCLNECDKVYQHLEAEIPSSTASAAEILAAVASIQYSAQAGIDAKNLTGFLRERLEQVAVHHRHRVPLHGRLVAQWLHYAFPRECPYPHLEATLSPQTPVKYEELHGTDSTTANDDEVQQFLEAEAARVAPSPEAGSEMWSFHEDILDTSTLSDQSDGGLRGILRLIAYFGMVACFGLFVVKAGKELFCAVSGQQAFSAKPTQYDV